MTQSSPTGYGSEIGTYAESGGGVADQAQEKLGQVADQAQEKLGRVADQAQGAAGQVAEQAKQQATSQLESQKGRAVDTLVTVAQALRQTGQHLQQQEQSAVGGYVEQAAERVESVTNYLRSRDVPELVADTEDFARRQPGLFLAGALAVGFIGARFLMSSGKRAVQREMGTPGQYRSTAVGSGPLDVPPYGGYRTGVVGAGEISGQAGTVGGGSGALGISGGLGD